MKDYDTFRMGGTVSVWIGNFSSLADLEEYFRQGFEKDFGFRLNDRDMPETTVEREPVKVEKLIDGFSRSRTFDQAAAKAAAALGFDSATTMAIFYNFKYDPEVSDVNPEAPL